MERGKGEGHEGEGKEGEREGGDRGGEIGRGSFRSRTISSALYIHMNMYMCT